MSAVQRRKPWDVYKSESEDGAPCWCADENFFEWTGEWMGSVSSEFPTHAEAIIYAQEQAAIQALAAHFTIPPNPIAAALMEPTC